MSGMSPAISSQLVSLTCNTHLFNLLKLKLALILRPAAILDLILSPFPFSLEEWVSPFACVILAVLDKCGTVISIKINCL